MSFFEDYLTRFDRRIDLALSMNNGFSARLSDFLSIGFLYFYFSLLVFMYYVTIGAGFGLGVWMVYMVVK